jgi:3-carboxy-cis,cis-muconate cycloisomerase
MKEGIGIILAAMGRLETALTAQVKTHAETIMAGRTWLQPGPPITLGLKLAGTLAALRRHRSRIEAASERAFVVQFGGAVGTLAALGDMGSEVSTELARLLELDEPELPWHTQRDNLVEVAAVLALLAGSLGKLAKDIALLMQAEVGEASEPAAEGRGGSSTMPQKRNPVACAAILVGAARIPGLVSTLLTAMPQEHERGLGLWQTEWETLPEIFRLTALALAQSIEIAEGLEVDAVRMTSNLNAMLGLAQSEGISAALAPLIGRSAAYEILRKATLEARTRQVHLAEILESIPAVTAHLSSAKIKRLLQPREYLGSTQRFIGRVLGEHDANR